MAYAIADIETRIDKRLVNLVNYPDDGLSDEDAYERHRQDLIEQSGSDFFPVVYHVPITVCVGTVASGSKLFNIELLGTPNFDEVEIVRIFWEKLNNFNGSLVTYNGRNFDLPVMELQALKHGISAPAYFNERFGHRYRFGQDGHYDLQDFLTNYGAVRLRGGLKSLARLLDLPGKSDMHGALVQGYWENGRLEEINTYCMQDVLLTYLLFLRVELSRGRIDRQTHDAAYHDALERFGDLAGESPDSLTPSDA